MYVKPLESDGLRRSACVVTSRALFCHNGEMMILGIGIVIIKIDRIRQSINRYGRRFTDRVFTPGEQQYCNSRHDPFESYAARFSAKEAAFKALGRGWDECGGFTSVEVVSDTGRRPGLIFYGMAKQYATGIGVTRALVSLTHHAGISAAVVILEK